jgi:hypothetical protein
MIFYYGTHNKKSFQFFNKIKKNTKIILKNKEKTQQTKKFWGVVLLVEVVVGVG